MLINPIKAIRFEKGLSKEEFAISLGISHHTLKTLEYGYVKKPSERVLYCFERLGCDPSKVESDYKEWCQAQKGLTK